MIYFVSYRSAKPETEKRGTRETTAKGKKKRKKEKKKKNEERKTRKVD
jgi:hypothetical protein